MANIKKMAKAKATMIYLDEVMRDEAKRRAHDAGMSMADFIRDALKQYMGEGRIRALRAVATSKKKKGRAGWGR
jgi:hypothetical protein